MKQFLISLRNTFSFHFWDVVGIGLAVYVIQQRPDVNELFNALLEWPLYFLMLVATTLVRVGDWLLLKKAMKGSLKGEFIALVKDSVRVVLIYLMTISAYFFCFVFF